MSRRSPGRRSIWRARATNFHRLEFQTAPFADTASRSRRRLRARFARNVPPSEIRGRRECRAPNAPAASRAERKKAHERSHHGHTGNHPAFPAQWFYGLLRALPGDQALLPPSPALLLADLTPTLGRQNHTTSPSAAAHFVKRAARVHRIPPHVRDVRTPLCRDGTGRISELIWVRWQAKFSEIQKSTEVPIGPGGPLRPIVRAMACGARMFPRHRFKLRAAT
jgi:hypothetical protein